MNNPTTEEVFDTVVKRIEDSRDNTNIRNGVVRNAIQETYRHILVLIDIEREFFKEKGNSNERKDTNKGKDSTLG